MVERNPLVASGEYVRIFVTELEPGMVNVFDEIVWKIRRLGDLCVSVYYTSTPTVNHFNNLNSTILIRADSIKD